MKSRDPLRPFLPPVQEWFRKTLGEPTPAQVQGWPAILAGAHTLIQAPTGSGKTLAAFLVCLDRLWRQAPDSKGVGVLYISPLKALNNDIHRNLQVPLIQVAETALRMGQPIPTVEAAVRTGDTPAAERRRLQRRPPHLLITTPESLHLLLTSQARDVLRNITHCIVDEIHALCGNKRGVFLALLLERLQALHSSDFVRIGLSATQRPLEEVARYLGGCELTSEDRLVPRPVTIVDAGQRKNLDLRVVCPVENFGPQPEKSIWPSIYRLLAREVSQHRSTIVFANNRRTVERITANLNEVDEVARAHHGSVALEVRRETEQSLKDGRLPAVVATASLELGIDMGAVDLVCQVESPGSVARGLQRVGRAGHLVGQQSKGRLIPKTPADLLEQAVLAREMAAGHVEEIRVPANCLDVLAQQVVAMAAMDDCKVTDMLTLVRRAYPYRDLSPEVFEVVLEMVSGRYQLGQGSGAALAALQARVSWDRIHNRLLALPGSRQLALLNGGAIPDTGQYGAYTTDGLRVGELDEEFIYERRVGDTFLLGTTAWRLEQIEADRVIVVPSSGAAAQAPFWRGEKTGRSFDLGVAIGEFSRELASRVHDPDCQDWLQRDYFLDAAAARNLQTYVRRQLDIVGTLPTDRTVLVEASRDHLGDWQVVILSPLGSRFHFALRLALENLLRRQLGYVPQCVHHDQGVLIRLADMDEPLLDLLQGLTPENVDELVLEELVESALFALRFRQNAARALLLPRTRPGKRAPLWLQRIRGRDLLQVARRQADFPIVVETFRECLQDHLELARLRELLEDVRQGKVKVVTRRSERACPFASELLFAFTAAYMYQYDDIEPQGNGKVAVAIDSQLLQQLVAPDGSSAVLDPRAIHQVERRLRGLGHPPRTVSEAAEWLRRLGDLAPTEVEVPVDSFLKELENDGRVMQITLAPCREPKRWILTEEEQVYRQAFGMEAGDPNKAELAAERILGRFLQTHALVGLDDLLDRYPFEVSWARLKLEEWARAGTVVAVPAEGGAAVAQWSVSTNLEQVRRRSFALLRGDAVTLSPQHFVEFVLRWQHLHPQTRLRGPEGLSDTLQGFEGLPLPAELWEKTVLPSRLIGYQASWLDACISEGEWIWACRSETDRGAYLLAFWQRGALAAFAHQNEPESVMSKDAESGRVLDCLRQRGALFLTDLAQETGQSPSTVRGALWKLLRSGIATNDRFDVIRKGDRGARTSATKARDGYVPRLGSASIRRCGIDRSDGRWSLLPGKPGRVEEQAVYLARALLRRYGIVAKELAMLDPWMLPWRVLYEVLDKMELSGQVRRGYFIKGLSGAQFALPEAALLLRNLDLSAPVPVSGVLLHSLDPANLFGSGAPFDMPPLEGGQKPFVRRLGNWLVIRAGWPVLVVEQHGRKISTLPGTLMADIAEAVALLPGVLAGDRGLSNRHKITVEAWNDRPVLLTEGGKLLESIGFVRDYQGMTLYAPCR